MKTFASLLLTLFLVGSLVWACLPASEGGSELHTHMDRCPDCARSPFGCPVAARISMKQAPWPVMSTEGVPDLSPATNHLDISAPDRAVKP